jgi:LuxR family transcriptional regulator, regulator of acetate metabolism
MRMKRSARTDRPAVDAQRRRADLVDRGQRLLTQAARPSGPQGEPAGLGELDAALAAVTDALRAQLPASEQPTRAADLLAAAYGLRQEIRDCLDQERSARWAALETGLARLRSIRDADDLLDRVCAAAAHSGGFDRVMLSQVEGSLWRPWKGYAVDIGDAERSFQQWIKAIPEIELSRMLLETEMARRREPALITDPARDTRVYQPLVRASRLRSYVAAPLMPAGRVIGFLHADYTAAAVAELDRDILWAFAEGFGRIFERAVLLSRLDEQREQVRLAMRTVESVLNDLASAEIALAVPASARASLRRAASLNHPPALPSVLTGRELEVLSLMATGATNQRIADELVISAGTVKSHVKRILRKLCVENRAEAIAQYLRLTIGDGGR